MQLKEEIEQYQISKGCLFFASNAIPRQFFSSVYFRLRYLVGNGRQVIVLQQQNTDRFLFHDSLDAPILCQKIFCHWWLSMESHRRVNTRKKVTDKNPPKKNIFYRLSCCFFSTQQSTTIVMVIAMKTSFPSSISSIISSPNAISLY